MLIKLDVCSTNLSLQLELFKAPQFVEIEYKLNYHGTKHEQLRNNGCRLQVREFKDETRFGGLRVQVGVVKALNNEHSNCIEEKVNKEADTDFSMEILKVEQSVTSSEVAERESTI